MIEEEATGGSATTAARPTGGIGWQWIGVGPAASMGMAEDPSMGVAEDPAMGVAEDPAMGRPTANAMASAR